MNTNENNDLKSDILDELLEKITPEMQLATDRRMSLAAKIAKARKSKGYTNEVLAKKLGVSIEDIELIQSGCYNTPSDTLFLLGDILEIKLINIDI